MAAVGTEPRRNQWMLETPLMKNARPSQAARCPRAAAREEDDGLGEERHPAREDVGEVRHVLETVRHERERDSRDPGPGRRACQRAREAERAVAAEREPEKHREAVYGEGSKPGGEGGKEQERDAPLVLGERERVPVREEVVRFEEVERIAERLVEIPRERPGVQVRVASVERRVAQVGRPGPRHDDGQGDEGEEDAGVLRRALQRFQVNLRGG